MPAQLVIRDGTPHWWNSPDIWVVPGTDPGGTPGPPIAGEPAYLWARVENRGDQAVSGARVEYYWSNPATGVLRSNSTLVGSAFVDLAAGEAKEILCLVPWIPVIVNDGHECVVAQAVHAADPLPSPLPDPFDPPSHHQIAQKNLSVLRVNTRMLVVPIQLATPLRQAKRLNVRLEFGGELDAENLARMRLDGFKPARHEPEVHLARESGCEPEQRAERQHEVDVELSDGNIRAVYLNVPPQRLEPRSYVLVHAIAREGKRVFGGITFILTAGTGTGKKER